MSGPIPFLNPWDQKSKLNIFNKRERGQAPLTRAQLDMNMGLKARIRLATDRQNLLFKLNPALHVMCAYKIVAKLYIRSWIEMCVVVVVTIPRV